MCLTWLRGKSLLLQEMKSDDCKWAIAVTQGSFTLRGHLYQLTFWCQFLQRKGKKCELWLQHQIILSMYKKITLRVTLMLYEQDMLLTPRISNGWLHYLNAHEIFSGVLSLVRFWQFVWLVHKYLMIFCWRLVSSLRNYSWPDLSLLFPVALYFSAPSHKQGEEDKETVNDYISG